MRTPAGLLTEMLRSDPGRPRLTWYDDAPGPTAGERIELSARVLSTWVSKVGNLLQEECDVGPERPVRLLLPPHWRSVVWALGCWAVGGYADLDGDAVDPAVSVSDDPRLLTDLDHPGVLVTLPALARQADVPVPAGVMDEAREIATYGDQLTPWQDPEPEDPALRAGGLRTAYEEVVPDRGWPSGVRVYSHAASLDQVLGDTLAAFAADGSIVLARGELETQTEADRAAAEGVTLRR